jgi:hypothetical protein
MHTDSKIQMLKKALIHIQSSMSQNTPTDANTELDGSIFCPETVGELYSALKKGIKCVWPDFNIESASCALKALIEMRNEKLRFKMYPSTHEGWTMLEVVT